MHTKLTPKAIALRKQGKSLSDISDALGISKSTASLWLRDFPLSKADTDKRKRENGLRTGRIQTDRKNQRHEAARAQAVEDIGILTERDLFMLGIALYIGEGTKWENLVRIVNADPKVIKLALAWLRKVCKVSDNHIRMRIHGHPDTDFRKAREFWSRTTGLAGTNFQSNVVDSRTGKSSKRRTLPNGTLHLGVVGESGGDISLGLRIRKWMEVVLD